MDPSEGANLHSNLLQESRRSLLDALKSRHSASHRHVVIGGEWRAPVKGIRCMLPFQASLDGRQNVLADIAYETRR